MAPSTSSFLDLKAQLSKQEAEFAQDRALGKLNTIKGGIRRPDKKPTVWAQPNKGVAARNARDLEWSLASKPTLDSAKVALERKAAQYEKLKRGKTAGLSEKQYGSLLVDFDRKAEEDYESESSQDIDESLTVPTRPDEDDPIVEYEDEFGRMRTAPKSEVPRNLQPLPAEETIHPEDDPYLIHLDGNSNYFPTYEQSTEKIAAVEAAIKEDANPASHYDATQEVRPRGAGFYQFSKDEEARQKQMEELRQSRVETSKAREESGAAIGKEVRPGLEKRKKEIEERRRAIEAKRRKVIHPSPVPGDLAPAASATGARDGTAASQVTSKPASEHSARQPQTADEFLAALERDILAARAKGG